MRFYSPLRYPGGKNCIYKFVANLFEENNLRGASYAEPYAGGAGLALRLLYEEYVDCIYINDLDRSIFAFWQVVVYRTDEFCEWLSEVEVSMDSWRHYREIQNNKESADLMELAKSTYFLNRTNISGVIKGGVIGGYGQAGKYRMDARFNKDDLIKRIRLIEHYKDRINISNLDGLAFVKEMDTMQGDVFIYLDPPYYQKGAELYMNFYSEHDHQRLSYYVHKMFKNWMVSYDNHEFILNLYAEKNKLSYKLSQSTSNRVGDEILIFSDAISFETSMGNLKSPIQL